MSRSAVLSLCKISLLVWGGIGLPAAVLGIGFVGGVTVPLALMLAWPIVPTALWLSIRHRPVEKPE